MGLLVTSLGLIFLLWQVTQSGRHERRRVQRRLTAARATLPLALHSICDYACRAGEQLGPMQAYLKGRGVERPEFRRPSTPDDVIAAIERMIGASSDAKIAGRLADIVDRIQVLHARLGGLKEKPRIFRTGIDGYVVDGAEIHALACSLFAYARRDTDSAPGPLKKSELTYGLHAMGIDEHRHPEVYVALERHPRWKAASNRTWSRWRLKIRRYVRKPVLSDC
jgi:hypothetical protein